jgi:hypothetical protein
MRAGSTPQILPPSANTTMKLLSLYEIWFWGSGMWEWSDMDVILIFVTLVVQ